MRDSINKTANLTPELFERFVEDMRAHLAKRRNTQLSVTATAYKYVDEGGWEGYEPDGGLEFKFTVAPNRVVVGFSRPVMIEINR